MRLVVQRVKRAAVRVDNELVGQIGRGFLVLLGAEKGDSDQQAQYCADKCAGLRIFEDDNGKMNLGLEEVGGEMLVVSQFTLCGDITRGRRPSFDNALPPQQAEELYRKFCRLINDKGINVAMGRFGAKMEVELVNDGPVTLILEN